MSYKGHGFEFLPKPDKSVWATWFSRKQGGLFVGVGVAVVVFAVWFWQQQDEARYQAIATEVGSVAEFWGDPSPNHAGTGIVYKRSTETGIGVFLSSIPGGERKLLYELPEKFADKDRGFQNLNVWSWAPDDSLFAFSYLNVSNRIIAICNGQTGEKEREAKVSRSIKDFVWLDANAVAYVNEKDDLYYWGAGNERRGSSPVSFVKKGTEKPFIQVQGLAAWGSESVAWHDGTSVWAWRFGEVNPAKLWEGMTNTLVDFETDSSNQILRLRFRDSTGDSVARYHVQSKRFESLAQLETLMIQTNRIVWLGARSYACAKAAFAPNILKVYRDGQKQPLDLGFTGGLNSYVANNSGLYVVGSKVGEPVGIWCWDGKREQLSCVVSNPMASYRHSTAVAPTQEQFATANGSKITYRMWVPPKISPKKQYPIIIGRASVRWNGYPIALANAGYYVVSIEQDDTETCWSDEVFPLLSHLEERINIKRSAMFLFGTSNHAWRASRVFDAKPELWQGMLLFCPGGSGPSLDNLVGKRLLIDCGADDPYSEGALRYRDRALERGIAITTVVHENAEHIYRSIRTLRSRDEAVIRFMMGL